MRSSEIGPGKAGGLRRLALSDADKEMRDLFVTWCTEAGCTGDTAMASAAPLTSREREILELMADGANNRLIAARLGISRHTVKFHVASILAKLHAGSRTEAVALALRAGLLAV